MKNTSMETSVWAFISVVMMSLFIVMLAYCGSLRDENRKLLAANSELHKSFDCLDASFNKLDNAFKEMESAKDDAVYMLRQCLRSKEAK
jgi:Tfp pilus assembly protein PilO